MDDATVGDMLTTMGGVGAASPTFTGVVTVPAGTVSAPGIAATGDSNTGIYFPAADTVAITEGGVEALRITDAGNLQFNSGYGSVATAYGCRAWVNFNGNDPVTIRGSGNVSSITDNGVGSYTINFTTPMPDANYAAVAAWAQHPTTASSAGLSVVLTNYTANSFVFVTYNISYTVTLDVGIVNLAVFR